MKQPLCALVATTALLAAGCQTPSQTIETTPVATTTVADTQGVIPRFTNDIWPAINAYNSDIGQGSPGYQQLIKISAELNADQYGKLHEAAQKLGTVREPDQTQGGSSRDGELHLASADLTALNPPGATLQVCYTFTALSYPTDWEHPKREPAASEATVELHKTDNWYLYSITNNHVVPGCQSSKA